jgi:flagellar biosynthesis/type III secretory pathway protein FliH
MGKVAREKKRQEHAETYQSGFNHGYSMGFDEGYKKAWEEQQRNVLKFAHRGK